MKKLVQKIRKLIGETGVLLFALNHPGTPWYASVLIVFTIIYAISPIDLIPDILPVLGFVDDYLILQTLVLLSFQIIPETVLNDSQKRLEKSIRKMKKIAWITAGFILLLWALLIILIIHLW
jgi:Uncharacterized conserved protein